MSLSCPSDSTISGVTVSGQGLSLNLAPPCASRRSYTSCTSETQVRSLTWPCDKPYLYLHAANGRIVYAARALVANGRFAAGFICSPGLPFWVGWRHRSVHVSALSRLSAPACIFIPRHALPTNVFFQYPAYSDGKIRSVVNSQNTKKNVGLLYQ